MLRNLLFFSFVLISDNCSLVLLRWKSIYVQKVFLQTKFKKIINTDDYYEAAELRFRKYF